LLETAVREIQDNRIVAWMHGRMEFGPRALGNRSILASPLDAYSTENLNTYIKHRVPFRKFAASVPAELADRYFVIGPNARFLTAVVGRGHKSSRQRHPRRGPIAIHTVSARITSLRRLLHATSKAAGLPVLYNTSFNLSATLVYAAGRRARFYSSGIDAMSSASC
jgi:carbamoyltransferase